MATGEDVDGGPDAPRPLPVKRIRSGVRRRILERLTEGRATVTVIAADTELRLPHASAELKRLREEGLVASDDATGSRGARLALTSRGWEMLRGDELARLTELAETPRPEGALGRLVSVQDDQLLVAFCRRPETGPLLLPSRPLDAIASDDGTWRWAVPRERRPRWLDAATLLATPAPPADGSGSDLTEWGVRAEVWGLQRFRILGDPTTFPLSSGAWFGEPSNLETVEAPARIPQEGAWRLGSLLRGGPEVRPTESVVALGLPRLAREALLAAAAPEGVTLSPQAPGAARGRAMPLDVLDIWVERAHSRMRGPDRVDRLHQLREALAEPGDARLRRRLDEATWRRFRQHWGDQSWSTERLRRGDWLDTSSLSGSASAALVAWALEEVEEPLILHLEEGALSELPANRVPANVRLLLTPVWTAPPRAHRLRPHAVLPAIWGHLVVEEGPTVPVHLAPPVSTAALAEAVLWSPPIRAAELEDARRSLGGDAEDIVLPTLPASSSRDRLLRAAVLCHPQGDADWSNRMESQHPLVAWIASTPDDRWSRWQRIGSTLGPGWVDLMSPTDLPVEAVASAARVAPPGWRRRLAAETRDRIRTEPEFVHALHATVVEAPPPEAGWVASLMLAEVAHLNATARGTLLDWGVDAFLDHPPARCADAIAGLDWLAAHHPVTLLAEPDDWRPRARNTGFQLAQDHDLHLWAVLEDWLVEGHRPHVGIMRMIIERLPEDWWATEAESMLTGLTEDGAGLAFLLEMDIAWPGLILRPQEEVHPLPGGSQHLHRGVRRTLLARLDRLGEGTDWEASSGPGARMIEDLRSALRTGRDLAVPAPGHSHAHVCWLALPQHLWPPQDLAVTAEGDARIASRLARRASGWHPELSSSPIDL